jgi:hypothetical protein
MALMVVAVRHAYDDVDTVAGVVDQLIPVDVLAVISVGPGVGRRAMSDMPVVMDVS